MSKFLTTNGPFELGNLVGADLMDDAPKLLDPRTHPSQLFLANLVVLRIAGLGVRFLEFLKHRAFTAVGLGPNTMKAPVESLRQGIEGTRCYGYRACNK